MNHNEKYYEHDPYQKNYFNEASYTHGDRNHFTGNYEFNRNYQNHFRNGYYAKKNYHNQPMKLNHVT